MHISFIVCLRYTPHQVPGRGGARHHPPRGVTHRFTPVRSHRRITTTTFRVRSSLLAATGPRNSRDGGGGGYGCGLEVDTAAVDALGGGWARLEVPAGRSEGQREGRRGRQNVRVRPKRAGFEAPGLLRTFVGGPATAQWAVAGEAPAPQLNDRSRPRPQRGNGRERLQPPAAHRHWRPLHELEPGRVAEAGARVQGSMEGLEPTFSTCSDARSSSTCCRRWAARRSALIDGRHKASISRQIVADRN
jgi:hypothetical protein